MELEQQFVAEPLEAVAEVEQAEHAEQAPRDYDAEARKHGWTPKEEFKGDPARWVDAQRFVERADEVMPLLKKQNEGLKREIDGLKKTFKEAKAHFDKTEERAYQRALSELQSRHDEAVETGDVQAARKVMSEMRDLQAPAPVAEEGPSEEQLRQELNDWIETTQWYGPDADRTKYADLQASLMGKAVDWPGGQKAWLDELEKRVDRKFTAPKPNPVNGGGNRGGGARSGKSFADLPAEDKKACDKFVTAGIFKDRAEYVARYEW